MRGCCSRTSKLARLRTRTAVSEVSYLLAVRCEIPLGLGDRIAAELVERGPGERKRDHRFAGDTCRWNHTDITAFVGGLDGLARLEVHAFQRTTKRGDRLQIPAHHNVFAIRDSTLDAAGTV